MYDQEQFYFSHFTQYLKSATTSNLQKTPPRLHCEMETRLMCDSHPPGSLPDSHQILLCPLGCYQLQLSPSPMCPTLGQGLTWRPDPAQKLGAPAEVGCPQWPLHHVSNSAADLSLCTRVFHLLNWCAWPFFPLSAFLASSCPIAGLPHSLLPSLSAFASRFVMYQLQWLLEILQHRISHSLPFFSQCLIPQE